MKKLVNKIGNMKLKNKLFLASYALVLMAVSSLFISLLFVTSQHLKKNALSSSEQAFELTRSQIETKLDNINLWSVSISKEPNLYETFKSGINLNDAFDANQKMIYIGSYLATVQNSDISHISLYLNMGKQVENLTLHDLSIAYDTDWYKYMIEKDINSAYWNSDSVTIDDEYTETDPTLSLIRLVKDPLQEFKIIGIIKIDFKESILSNIMNEKNSYFDSICYIQSADNTIYTSTNKALTAALDEDTKSFFFNSDEKWNFYESGTEKYYVKCEKIHNTNLYMVNAIVWDGVYKLVRSILPLFITILVITLLLSYAIARIFSNFITKRITDLAINLRDVGSKYLSDDYLLDNSTNDDMSIIINTCNHMIAKLHDFSNKQFRDGQKLKEAEFRVLREQINPHFLYNTLNLINYLAATEHTSKISSAVDALAKFYKISLSNGTDIITIREELNHIIYYTQIQNMRFDDRITLSIDVPDEIQECHITKIILQPLVENSITHGILPKPGKTGKIEIKAYFEDNDIIIEVKDDGIGIEPHILQNLLSDSSKGFGLRNTDLRLKLYYGNNYGITIQSEYGKYTLVKVKFSRSTNLGGFIND